MEEQYEIGSSPNGTYVYARAFRHPYTLSLAMTLAGEIIPLGEKLGVLGCLIDLRGTTSVSSASDKYMFAYEKAKDTGLPRHWRVAILKDHGDDSPDFIWTAMENAGYIIQVFEDEREAIDWIEEHRPANKPDAGDA